MIAKKIGIDLGTVNTLIYVPKKGIVIQEPSVVALDIDNKKVLAIGKEAEKMLGKNPESISLYRPLRSGVIADFHATASMLDYHINQTIGRFRFVKPDVMISIPGGATSTERKAVVDAVLSAGARSAYIIQEPVAAALGAGLPITEPTGNMIINIGGGTTEIAVISLGGVVSSASIRVGGNKIDIAISEHLRRYHGLSVGDKTATEIKHKIGSALAVKKPVKMEIKGRDIVAGLPKTISLTSNDLTEVIQDKLDKIILAVRNVLEQTPPELVSDIIDRGITLSGGGSLLNNIDNFLTKKIGVPSIAVKDPLTCVALGTGIALQNLSDYQKGLLAK
jgi:rod shape-determining protein MreB and related proteins